MPTRSRGKTIYHFGTGTHHIVGLTQAANGSDNVVFGITASIVEYEAYIKLANERPQLSKYYLAYFGDIYLTNPRLLPALDVVTMFHAGEYIGANTTSPEYGGVDDLGVARILLERMRPDGRLLFYTGSFAFDKADALAQRAGRREEAGAQRSVQVAAGVPEGRLTRESQRDSLHVERLGSGRLAGIEGDLLHPRLGLAQQFLAAALQRLAALVDRDRLLERHGAALELLHDLLEFGERLLEAELLDVGIGIVGHHRSDFVAATRAAFYPFRGNLSPPHPRISAVTCAATERASPSRS